MLGQVMPRAVRLLRFPAGGLSCHTFFLGGNAPGLGNPRSAADGALEYVKFFH